MERKLLSLLGLLAKIKCGKEASRECKYMLRMLDILLIFGIPYCINLLICQFGLASPLQQSSHAYALSFEKGTGSRKTGFLPFHVCIRRDLDFTAGPKQPPTQLLGERAKVMPLVPPGSHHQLRGTFVKSICPRF